MKKVRRGCLLDLFARLQPLPEEFPDVDDTLVSLDDVELKLPRQDRGDWEPSSGQCRACNVLLDGGEP